MMFRKRYLLVLLGLCLAGTCPASTNDLDAALRGGDMSKVLELLGPGEVEEASDPAADTTAVIESLPASGPDGSRTSHRITLRTANGEEKVIEGSQRKAPGQAVRSDSGLVPVPVPEGQPRKAIPIRQPSEVPLVRPRVTYTTNVDPASVPTNEVGVAAADAATDATPADAQLDETPAVAPEDRNLAAAELVKLLKSMERTPDTPSVANEAAGAEAIPPPDEDQARSKPLDMRATPAATVTTVTPGPTALTPDTATPATSPNDIVRQTRANLEGLLREAKRDAFGSGTVTISARPGSIPEGGWRYSGQWREGHMDGFGTLRYPDGWTYEGDWQEGRIVGTGTLTHPDGWQYTGEWRDGRMDGEGVLTYPDGWRYVGEWRDGKMHGKGELIHPDG